MSIFVPALVFSNFYFGGLKLDHQKIKEISKFYKIPNNIKIFGTKENESNIFVMPFFSILHLSQDVVASPYSKSSRGAIAHEIGHFGQYDRLISNSLYVSIFFYLITIMGMVISSLRPKSPMPYLADWDMALYVLLFLFVGLFQISLLIRILHRREYWADYRAARIYPEEIEFFLKTGARREKYEVIGSPVKKLKEKLFHPKFESRLEVFKTGPEYLKRDRLYYAVWAFCLLAITVVFGTGAGNPTNSIFGQYSYLKQWVVGEVFFATLAWYFISAQEAEKPSWRRHTAISHFLGVLAFTVSVGLIFTDFSKLFAGSLIEVEKSVRLTGVFLAWYAVIFILWRVFGVGRPCLALIGFPLFGLLIFGLSALVELRNLFPRPLPSWYFPLVAAILVAMVGDAVWRKITARRVLPQQGGPSI